MISLSITSKYFRPIAIFLVMSKALIFETSQVVVNYCFTSLLGTNDHLRDIVIRVGVNSFLSIPNSIPIPFYQFLSQFQFLRFYEKSIPIQFQFLKSQFLFNST